MLITSLLVKTKQINYSDALIKKAISEYSLVIFKTIVMTKLCRQ